MKRIFYTLFLFSLCANLNSQIIQTRVLYVETENVKEFESAVAKKTQMFNGKGSKEKWFTFKILTGPNAMNYSRVRLAEDLSELDYQNKKGNEYWFKNVPHTSGTQYTWRRNNEASYITGNYDGVNHRRIVFVSYKYSKRKDFWTFRYRVKKVLEKMQQPYNRGVFSLISGGSRPNVVMIRYLFKSYEEEQNWRENEVPKIKSTYKELFGDEAWEMDYTKYRESMVEDWGMTRHHAFMPELSSPRD